MANIPNFIGNPQGGPAGSGQGRSCFHGFNKNSNGNLEYTRITSGEVKLKDGNNVDLFTEKYIGDRNEYVKPSNKLPIGCGP